MATYVDEVESDLSVFHGLDFWSTSVAVVMRLARRLPAYDGALRRAMDWDDQQLQDPAVELPTAYPQAVDNTADGDTPPEVVAQLQQQAMINTFRGMGVEVTEIKRISDSDMRDLVNHG